MNNLLDTHYFAYGTLLGGEAMRRLCPSAELIAQGQVAHRSLTFRKYAAGPGQGGCSIVEEPQSVLLGAVYRITPEEFLEMDHRVRRELRWFDRLAVDVRTIDGQLLNVSTYHIPMPIAEFAPSEEYTRDIFDGAASLSFPAWYVRRLNEIVEAAVSTGTP